MSGSGAALVVAACFAGVACDGDDEVRQPTPDATLPWASEPFPEVAAVDEAVADLGRLLFYDPILSSDGETACATCHSEIWGMSDGLPTSIGVGGGRLTGPGRAGGTALARNAPTLWNVTLRGRLFLDGREGSLEAQAAAPLLSPIELGRAPDEVVAALAQIPEYAARFGAAFPDEGLDERTFRAALAAFQRTLVSDRSLYDAYAGGDRGAMNAAMIAGMETFAAFGCDGCHAPPTFEADAFFARGIGAGGDRGRAGVTGRAEDEGAFRVPTLRNVRESAPYFHDGSVPTLEEAITHEVMRDVGRPPSDAELEALAAFIGRALVDRSREPDRPEVVPSGLPVPLDGFRVLRP